MKNKKIRAEKTITPFKCKWCESYFYSEGNLTAHIKTAKFCLKIREDSLDIQEAPKIKFECEYCKAIFTQKIRLKSHILICDKRIMTEHNIELKKIKEDSTKEKNKLINELNKKNDDLINEFNKKTNELTNELNKEKDEFEKIELAYEKQTKYIRELERELSEKEGCIIGLSMARPKNYITNNTGNTYINPKLANLPVDHIRPLNVETVREDLKLYTMQEFQTGLIGIISFIKKLIIMEISLDPNEKLNVDSQPLLLENSNSTKNESKSMLKKETQDSLLTYDYDDYDENDDYYEENSETNEEDEKAKVTPKSKFVTSLNTTSTTSSSNITSTTTPSTITFTTSSAIVSTELSSSNNIIEKNYACTDTSRNSFHLFSSYRTWERDWDANFINTIFDELKDTVRGYYNILLDKLTECSSVSKEEQLAIEKKCKNFDERLKIEEIHAKKFNPHEAEKYDMIIERVKPIYFGIIYDGQKERKKLLKNVIREIKKLVNIK